MKNKTFKILVSLSVFCLSSCGTSQVETTSIVSENELSENCPRATYDNSFGEDRIPDYWPSYGIGDPFVYRYDGTYYLVCSTKAQETGIRGWKSTDLMNWQPVQAEGISKGYITMADSTYVAFAPEVLYSNGWFYLIESRRGNGHYILRSRSPEGPFTDYVGNFGEFIDGSFFVDDDESIYMLRASNQGVRANLFDENMAIKDSKQLANTEIGSWTEGPNMVKRDGIYYLAYTGTAVTSAGYRIAYSYHNESDGTFFSRNAFTYGNIVLLNSSDAYNGLGHGAFVTGPDLDSEYFVYHNLLALSGPYRHFNLTRVFFNGSEMSFSHPDLTGNLVPKSPDFSTRNDEGFLKSGNQLLSEKSTGPRYTAEFNITGSGEMIFDYLDPNNYCFLSNENNALKVRRVSSGNISEIASCSLNKTYDYSYLHTYQIKCADEKLQISFDNMCKISTTLSSKLTGGKIGYSSETVHSYTAFANNAFNSSQNEEYKQDTIPSSSFDLSKSKIDDDGIITTEKSDYGNGVEKGLAVQLKSQNNRACYRVYVDQESPYGLEITLPSAYLGKKIGVRVDNGSITSLTIPESEETDDRLKFRLCNVYLSKGTHFLTLYYVGDKVAFSRLDLFQSTGFQTTFSNDLSSFITKGVTYVNAWKIKYGGHYALSGNRQMMYLGSDTMCDYSVDVDITLEGDTQASTAGVLLRANNPAFSKNDDFTSVQGFYCGFNNSKIFITECNYNQTISNADEAKSFASGTSYHLQATCHGNKISLSVDGVEILTYFSLLGMTHGRASFYTNGAAAIYKNVKITTF